MDDVSLGVLGIGGGSETGVNPMACRSAVSRNEMTASMLVIQYA